MHLAALFVIFVFSKTKFTSLFLQQFACVKISCKKKKKYCAWPLKKFPEEIDEEVVERDLQALKQLYAEPSGADDIINLLYWLHKVLNPLILFPYFTDPVLVHKGSLEEAIASGHAEDISFLVEQVILEHSFSSNPLFCDSFNAKRSLFRMPLLATFWENARRERCRQWLVDSLGFEEEHIELTPWKINLVHKFRKVAPICGFF